MDRIDFSVVIATYNRGDLIVPAIRSALGQTYPAAEIIVVGDGCTDKTGEILAAHFGDRVRWQNLEANTGGQSFPNNEGIRLARSAYVAYLGHDDIWSPDHLAALAGVIEKQAPDVTVSGAIFHTPEGCDQWQITGIFDDPFAAAREFFPPSSLAHRRDLTDRIGGWAVPSSLKMPADCELLLRAVKAGCRFASTGRVTVHKFAAGHRYLSYRFPSAREQTEMLEHLREPEFERTMIANILDRVAHGGTVQRVTYSGFDTASPGFLFGRSRASKGLSLPPPVNVERTTRLELDDTPGALDWHDVERDIQWGPFRWSSRNPNPIWLVNIRTTRAITLQIPIMVAEHAILRAFRVLVNDAPAAFEIVEGPAAGRALIMVRPEVAGPIEGGLKLTFQTRQQGPARQSSLRDRRFALRPITVVVDDPLLRPKSIRRRRVSANVGA